MVKITSITPSTIKFEGINFSDGHKVEQIMDICHKYKHLYKDGYPCGRRTRKAEKNHLKKWADCPNICFTYLATNDTEDHFLKIIVLVSDKEALLEQYSEEDINKYLQKYILDVANEIINTIE